ncbi:oxysterol-binding protein-related protein 1-like isoform X3 [Gadus macrocephalus]|uniref:oxysterol-binding protein-related protein 1-like isoform X3 n=1 Tax=Gadus macrocephalus TaxID=80720 RepID=UPI0028CB2B8E|nr:oxysterol-binding protein-related protein 1-like isoform X3 [Gadus macrocephalus]
MSVQPESDGRTREGHSVMDPAEPEAQLLLHAEEGDRSRVQSLLQLMMAQGQHFNLNCRSRSDARAGWTPLHLSSHFGHTDVVEDLLKAGAHVNLQDDLGDTPLHKAASSGRKEIVLTLLRYDACASIINGTAQVPRNFTEDDEIITMLEAAERRAVRRKEDNLLHAAREGDVAALSKLLSLKEAPDVHCRDLLGNTPLHCAAYRGQEHCVVKLLKHGASPSLTNKKAQTAFDIACTDELKQILAAAAVKETSSTVEKCEGPLWKSSRFLGWRYHWVVLENGNLSWYLSRADARSGHRRQGSEALALAYCMIKPWDNCYFALRRFDSTDFHFKVSSKTNSITTRRKWLDAFDVHSAYSSRHCSQEQAMAGHDEEEGGEDAKAGDSLTRAFEEASASQEKLECEVSVFLSMVKNEQNDALAAPLLLKARQTSALSGETCTALQSCLALLSQQEEVWHLKLEQELEKNKALTEALQILATERYDTSLSRGRKSPTPSALTGDFYDAESDTDSELSLSGFLSVASRSYDEDEARDAPLFRSLRRGRPTGEPRAMSGDGDHGNQAAQCNGVKKYRSSLPAPMFSRNDISVWSILKKCIGMELSKIAMPVMFNEPLSFLQRLAEYMEHTYLLQQANTSTDSVERMKCVAAFAVSAVASQWERTGKPFNPLLGETYELIREDLGFRWVSEQVSHHPPVSAFHAEGLKEDFLFHGSIYPKLKFWGKSVEAEPKGVITLELPKHNEAYTWTNPTCCVHNIIVGQLWIEQYGQVEVINHKTGERCSLTFKPCGLFGKELHKVEGYILDKSKKKLCAIYGKWTECLYAVDPAAFEAHRKADKKSAEEKKTKQGSADEEPEELPPPDAETVQVIPGSELIWRIAPRPDNSAQFYAFSTFAMQLNELERAMEESIPSTDCRLRPDIRAMEVGDIDLSSGEKKRLEEKQRLARKNRSKSSEEWKTKNPALGPRWFAQGPNPHNKAQDWLFSKGYWERNYNQLPNIY